MRRVQERTFSLLFLFPRQSLSRMPYVKNNDFVVFDCVEDRVVEATNVLATHTLLLGLLSRKWKFSQVPHASFDGVRELLHDQRSMLSQIFDCLVEFLRGGIGVAYPHARVDRAF